MKTKPDLYCTIEELSRLSVLPHGWVMLRRQSKETPDFIDIKYLGGVDPLDRISELETQLLAHLENEGDECPLCAAEAEIQALRTALDTDKEILFEALFHQEKELEAAGRVSPSPVLPILTNNDAAGPADEVFAEKAVSRFLKGFRRGYEKGSDARARFSRIFPGLGDLL